MCCIANDMLSTTDIENKFEASFRTKICQRIHTHCGTKIHVEMLARTHTNTDSTHLCQVAPKTPPNHLHASTHLVSNLCIYQLTCISSYSGRVYKCCCLVISLNLISGSTYASTVPTHPNPSATSSGFSNHATILEVNHIVHITLVTYTRFISYL